MKGKRAIGERGEDLAANYLEDQGLQVFQRNFHTQLGEIDLLARDGEQLVFIEVKLRNSDLYGTAIEAFTPRKLSRVIAAAEEWIIKNDQEDTDYRIDLIAIQNGEIEWIRDFGS